MVNNSKVVLRRLFNQLCFTFFCYLSLIVVPLLSTFAQVVSPRQGRNYDVGKITCDDSAVLFILLQVTVKRRPSVETRNIHENHHSNLLNIFFDYPTSKMKF